jgi:site-specific DNA recombinase
LHAHQQVEGLLFRWCGEAIEQERVLADNLADRCCWSRPTALRTALLERAELKPDGMRICITLRPLLAEGRDGATGPQPNITRLVLMQMKRRGVELRLVIDGRASSASTVDPALLKAIARARSWFEELRSGRVTSLDGLAARGGVHRRYLRYVLPLAFLAPDIVEAIAAGRQPAELTAQTLIKRVVLPLDWANQKRTLGIE